MWLPTNRPLLNVGFVRCTLKHTALDDINACEMRGLARRREILRLAYRQSDPLWWDALWRHELNEVIRNEV